MIEPFWLPARERLSWPSARTDAVAGRLDSRRPQPDPVASAGRPGVGERYEDRRLRGVAVAADDSSPEREIRPGLEC